MHGIKMNVYLISRQNCLLICPSVRLADNILTLVTFYRPDLIYNYPIIYDRLFGTYT